MRKQATPANEWIKADLTPDRALDAIDHELAWMAKPIRHINSKSVRFTEATKSAMVIEWRECAKLNRELIPRQRVEAVQKIASGEATQPLLTILRSVADH